MRKLLLLSALLCTFDATTANAGLTTKSLEALKRYCVPGYNDAYGILACNTVFEGIYKQDQSCQCYDADLIWNAEKRHCVAKCSGGYVAKKVSQCSRGKYKRTMQRNDSIAYICKSCSTNTWSDGTFTSCKSCLTTGVASCEPAYGKATSCKAGYGLSNGTCSYCPAGTYSAGGTNACTLCPAGTYSSAGSSSCIAGSGPTYSNWTITKYTSKPGSRQKIVTVVTATCGDATRTKTTYCTKAGSTSSTDNSVTVNESGVAGTCSAGQTCSNGSCVSCSAGTYKSSAGNEACSACADPTYGSWDSITVNMIIGGSKKVTPTCGEATRNKTTYCTVAGSTSSTANPSTEKSKGIAGTCSAGYICSNHTCAKDTSCTKIVKYCSCGNYSGHLGDYDECSGGGCGCYGHDMDHAGCDLVEEQRPTQCPTSSGSPDDWGYCKCAGGGGSCAIGGGDCQSSSWDKTTVTQRKNCNTKGESSSWQYDGREGSSGSSCTFTKADVTSQLGKCSCVTGCENCTTTYSNYEKITEEECKKHESQGDRGGTSCSWTRGI